MMIPATTAPMIESSPPRMTTGKTVIPKACSVSKFFPTIGRVRTTEEILAALG
jgi:hypothetical protein